MASVAFSDKRYSATALKSIAMPFHKIPLRRHLRQRRLGSLLPGGRVKKRHGQNCLEMEHNEKVLIYFGLFKSSMHVSKPFESAFRDSTGVSTNVQMRLGCGAMRQARFLPTHRSQCARNWIGYVDDLRQSGKKQGEHRVSVGPSTLPETNTLNLKSVEENDFKTPLDHCLTEGRSWNLDCEEWRQSLVRYVQVVCLQAICTLVGQHYRTALPSPVNWTWLKKSVLWVKKAVDHRRGMSITVLVRTWSLRQGFQEVHRLHAGTNKTATIHRK